MNKNNFAVKPFACSVPTRGYILRKSIHKEKNLLRSIWIEHLKTKQKDIKKFS